ncbi:MAG: proline dehydrogenase family protein [Candidatus Micrarchaeia archaeon]
MRNVLEKLIAGKWIAGPDVEDAIERSMALNKLGIRTIINYLGEEFKSEDKVEDAMATYAKLIKEIKRRRVEGDISVKITQLGLRIGKAYATKNYLRLASLAKPIFLWLDMESSDTVDATIGAYEKALHLGNVGICLQAYLKRSYGDMKRLVKKGGVIRLVKGAYKERPEIAFQNKQAVNANFEFLMNYLFKHASKFTLATHDKNMIEKALLLNRSYQRQVTYAFLNGIRGSYARMLAERGERVAVYVPFGKLWADYAIRRMREQGHAMLVLRSLFGS